MFVHDVEHTALNGKELAGRRRDQIVVNLCLHQCAGFFARYHYNGLFPNKPTFFAEAEEIQSGADMEGPFFVAREVRTTKF